MMTKEHHILDAYGIDAIVGMSYIKNAVGNMTPLFDTLMNQKLLNSNMFSYNFVLKDEARIPGLQSDLTIGYYDTHKYKGDIKWYPIFD